jgi:hypothetical protein
VADSPTTDTALRTFMFLTTPGARPECNLGHTAHELDLILEDRRLEFDHWMRGQTMGICDGRKYNHDTGEYEPTGCGPHGTVVYSWDLARFLHGLPVTD